MATRYWHWLLAQQQKKDDEYYEIRGTVAVDAENNFYPEYDYESYEEDGLIINVENENS